MENMETNHCLITPLIYSGHNKELNILITSSTGYLQNRYCSSIKMNLFKFGTNIVHIHMTATAG